MSRAYCHTIVTHLIDIELRTGTIMPPKRRGQASASSKCTATPCTPPPSIQHSAVLNETPLSKKISGATPYTSMHYKRDMRMKDLGTEMTGKFAGPISPLEFMQTFLPFKRGELEPMPKRRKKVFQNVADQRVETAMYGPMVCPLYSIYCAYLYDSTRLRR
jgi:hypothetical protein